MYPMHVKRNDLNAKSRMKGDFHVRFRERLRVKFPWSTRQLFLNYLPYQSLTYKLLWLTEGDLMLNRCEWKDDIEFIVNPTDEKYTDFFTKPWNRQMVEQMYPRRSAAKELKKILGAFYYMIKNKVKSKAIKHIPVTLDEYMKLKNKK